MARCSEKGLLTTSLTPFPLPPSFWTFGRFFLTDWEALCTALRLGNIRHRSEETMSNMPLNLNNSTLLPPFDPHLTMLKKLHNREGHPYPQKGHFDTVASSVWAECIIHLLLRYQPLRIYAEPLPWRARIFHCLGNATWFAPIFHWSERVNWSCGLILAQPCT